MKKTMMEREIARVSHIVTVIGTGMAYGHVDVEPGNESLFQMALASMISRNDQFREKQERTFAESPWLIKACRQ